MASIFNLLKPAPYIKPIQDSQEIECTYNYWRIRILYSMFVGYAFYYFTRKSFTFAMPDLAQELHYDKTQLGILGSIFSITYGLSKFASGILSDRSNPRYFMAIGLMMTGVANILFGLSSSIFLFCVFWGLNGWFQGFGWPPCARFLTHWYSHSERGAWWSTCSVSHNVGTLLIPWIVGACLYFLGWRYAMYIPGFLCILGGLFLINRLRDTPQSLGLPSIEDFRKDYSGFGANEGLQKLSTKEILVEHVLKNGYMWMLGLAYFFVYIVRTGVNDWTVLYLLDEKGYSRMGANACISLFEVGGFVGSLCAGWSSDRLFGARRGPVNVLFAAGMMLSVLIFWLVPEDYVVLDAISIFMLGFTIFGPQMLIGVAAAELSHKQAAATSTGFVGFCAYMGAACAGAPLGKITDYTGWEGYFISMIVCGGISMVALLPLWNATKNPRLMKVKAKLV
ncbi:phosphoglycerate transporter protein PgtP [Parachlamydia sp. AcF125]|uniref:phosphoglycerate transporter protein PgtP n=1 Tax=Parachlamydia sp. AcF125 TaxID=2795736 RepID=UPI001BC8E250